MHLWIDRQPFYRLAFPNKIRIWGKFSTKSTEDLYRTKYTEEVMKFDEIKIFIQVFFTELVKKQKYFNSNQTDKN